MAVSIESPREARSGSLLARLAALLVGLCALVPYALVAIGLRFLMARVFFIEGQPKIEGPAVPITLFGRDAEFSLILPAAIKDSTFRLFETQYAALPLPPTTAAYLYSYAEFLLPVCLVLGFATRLSALVLLILTVLMLVYVSPQALWTTQVYWIAILMVLMSVGPGAISLDGLVRYVYRK
jgi:putative oxidoreductase